MNKYIILFAVLLASLSGTGQNIFVYRSVSELNRPELTWYTLDKNLKPEFRVFRAPVGSSTFTLVLTPVRNASGHDTLFIQVIDTTLTAKGLYQYYIKGTGTKDTSVVSEVMYGHNLGHLPKPQVVSFTATPVPGRKALELNWKLNYDFTVKTVALFRSRHYERGFELVAILPADTTRYEDIVDVSNEAYFYFLQIRDFFGYQLPSVVIHGISTYAGKAYPPQNFNAVEENGSVVLSWRVVGQNITGYRVYKSMAGQGGFLQAGPVVPAIPGKDSLVVYTDTAVHVPGQLVARYYAVTVSDGYLESNPSDTVTVMLPWNIVVAPPAEVDNVLDPNGSVQLFWTVAEANSGVSGYNVYRSLRGGTPKKLNTSLIPVGTNTFTDTVPGENGSIGYSVESVSVAGKPSALRTTVTVERPLVAFHLVVSAGQSAGNVSLTWTDPGISNLDALYIYRQIGNGPAELRSMVKPGKQTWTDAGVPAGSSCIYTFLAEFKDGTRFLVNDGVLVVVQ